MESEIDPWQEYEKESEQSGQFFSPKEEVQYKVILASFELKKEAFKSGDKEKWTLKAVLKSLDGKPSNLKWNTKSFTIIKAVKPYKDDFVKLGKVTWLLRKKKDGDKISYVFEDLGVLSPAPSQGLEALL